MEYDFSSCVHIFWSLVEIVLTSDKVLTSSAQWPKLQVPNYFSELYPFVSLSHTPPHKSHYHIHRLEMLVRKTNYL